MKVKNRNKMKRVFFAALFVLSGVLQAQNTSKFRVCLDAGHGNQDFGATYHGYVEKQINLAIVLKLGAILEKDPTIDVIYTRKTDTFIELVERANIANKNKANIFVSIHCNANKNLEAYGSETYVMGLSKSASSLAVARKENEVIKLEDNYKTKYAGYNPNAPESLISATIAQEEYLDQSIELASRIQDNFDQKVNRKNRGVHQAPFMVLHKAFMPRVLVETGFISNQLEGAYLNSEEGQENVARSIADAIFRMKAEHFGGSVPFLDIKKSEKPTPKDTTPKGKEVVTPVKDVVKQEPVKSEIKTKTIDNQKVVFKVQLKASNMQIDIKPENFNGLSSISSVFEGGYYKYMYGETNDYQESRKMLTEVKNKGYESAFIVPYKNGVKISLNEAVKSAK
ncbi:N-acetylmuramoyl-L-alanine amidase [Flavobacterium columnare]|uniref:N-acetylmuramoyl-L-alanine amidase n=2 Tax=Flavobacterium columnare TaxID=996 RepID=A0AAI8CJL5_9FLAO|nr:N-acetylmuramoyl-L-alanine amidase [Flavobacterium columnare]AUX17894.1 N-acetylmuramoyl-L-alanine amidase [Flavobacterium columnare]MEB3800821.1 N-acetylmuramoyl-L-alanine amidase [Flavobacterium columnare]QOG56961.1 N-acetylmuramoyl-L-alanine amidase [Flavobacterium columnare]QOG59685.1 N-acetylmuramoyl-L-alanine amidase [Flavobacterium columnare]